MVFTCEKREGIAMEKLLLVFNCVMLVIGAGGGPLMLRLYTLHGGKKIILSSWAQTGGWPIILIPLIISYFHRRKIKGRNAKLLFIKPSLFLDFVFIGFLIFLVNYFYAYGYAKLPVSTACLIASTLLVFNAFFAFLLVNQKFTVYSITGIIFSTIGAAVLSLDTSSDVPSGESNFEYFMGLIMMLSAAVLFGFTLPWMELRCVIKAKQELNYTLMMETQMVMSFFATTFATITMFINNTFREIPKEAKEFDIGQTIYYVIILSTCIIFQSNCIGMIGTTVCGSSLLTGVIMNALLPIVEVLAVILYQEKFQAGKVLSLVLSLLGSTLYFYGEMKYSNKLDQTLEIKSPLMNQNV